MRRIATLLGLLGALLAGAAAAAGIDFSDPRAVVEAAYAPYVSGEEFDWSGFDIAALQSEGLNALYARDAEEAGDEVGRIDFDPLINAQDYDLEHLVIGPASVSGATATVEVTFENMGRPERIEIVLVHGPNGYRIDDVRSFDPEYPYSLRALLEAPLPR